MEINFSILSSIGPTFFLMLGNLLGIKILNTNGDPNNSQSTLVYYWCWLFVSLKYQSQCWAMQDKTHRCIVLSAKEHVNVMPGLVSNLASNSHAAWILVDLQYQIFMIKWSRFFPPGIIVLGIWCVSGLALNLRLQTPDGFLSGPRPLCSILTVGRIRSISAWRNIQHWPKLSNTDLPKATQRNQHYPMLTNTTLCWPTLTNTPKCWPTRLINSDRRYPSLTKTAQDLQTLPNTDQHYLGL